MIVGFEGLPGAGKSTLISRMAYPAVPEMLVSEEEEAGFTEADYLEHDRQKYSLAQSLGRQGLCLMDRTSLSWYAYQFASKAIDESAIPVTTNEDLVYIYFRIPPELSVARRLPGRWVPSVDFIRRTAYFYDLQFENNPALVASIDSSKSLEEIHDDLTRVVLELLDAKGSSRANILGPIS